MPLSAHFSHRIADEEYKRLRTQYDGEYYKAMRERRFMDAAEWQERIDSLDARYKLQDESNQII